MEAIKEIRLAEEQAAEIRKRALQKARDIMRLAEDEGNGFSDRVVRRAQEEGRQILAKAEEEAQNEIEVLKRENQEECARIKSIAEKNLQKAVTFVMERIVKAHGHH